LENFRKKQSEAHTPAKPASTKPGIFQKVIEAFGTSAARAIAGTLGRSILRGPLGNILGGAGRGRKRGLSDDI
jgi:hypothetical protein